MPRNPDSIEDIAINTASTFSYLSKSQRPTVICVLRIGSGRGAQSFTGESANVDRDMHDTINQVYQEVPTVYQSVNNGRCAEADALSKALRRGIDRQTLKGAECQAVLTNKLRLVPPCQSCTQILRRLGIKYTGDVDFNPVLAEINALQDG